MLFVSVPYLYSAGSTASLTKATYPQFIGGLIGSSQATTFNGLMAARCIHSFGGGICEALPVQLVNDIFFLHERGERLGYYTGESSWQQRSRNRVEVR